MLLLAPLQRVFFLHLEQAIGYGLGKTPKWLGVKHFVCRMLKISNNNFRFISQWIQFFVFASLS